MKERVITIGFSTSRRWNPFSALIKRWWGTPYSHTYLKWDTPWGFSEVLEASGTSVRMVNDEIWKKKNRPVYEKELVITREEFNRMMSQLRPLTGTPYGWGQVMGIILKELFRLKKNPFSDGADTFVCSELVLKFLRDVANICCNRMDSDSVSPHDIYEIVKELDER